MEHSRTPRDWKDCEFLSLAEAARVVGRSSTWTRAAICIGELEAVYLPTGGREVVTVKSLKALVSRSRPVPQQDLAVVRPLSPAVH
jgi:hypothetical protein